MTEYPYQATIVGNESLPNGRRMSRFNFLHDLAKKLKPGQHVRLIVPNATKKMAVTGVWYAISGKGKPHTMIKKNDKDTYAVHLWFGSAELPATSKLLRNQD